MLIFAGLSYGLAAAGFTVLLLLLLTSWRGRISGALLVAAALISALWAVVAALAVGDTLNPADQHGFISTLVGPAYAVLETARSVCWLLLLFGLLRPLLRRGWVLVPQLALVAVVVLLLSAELGALFNDPMLNFKLAMVGHVCLALAGLVLIEQLVRNTVAERRWATKYLYIGLGAMFVFDFYLFTDALLLQRVNVQIWAARGAVNALVVPLLAVAAARNPIWSLDIFVSRQVVLHTAAIVGAGIYLLAMAGAGYYVLYFGGNWGFAVQLVFFAAAGMLLLTLIFSGQLRSSLTVFLSKHFFNYKYDYRAEWLRFSNTLAATAAVTSPRQRAIQAIAEIVHSPGGLLLNCTGPGRAVLAVAWGTTDADPDVELTPELYDFLASRRWVIDLYEARKRPESYPGLILPAWLNDSPRAWAVVPLLQGETLRGMVVLTRPRVSQRLNWEDWDLLKTAGRQVAGFVALLDTTDELMDARQFEAFNRLSAYVVHDLKNVAAQLALVVNNAARHKANPAFVDDAIATVANATERMNRMLGQLRKGGGGEVRRFAVDEALREALAALQHGTASAPPETVLRLPQRHVWLTADRDRFVAVVGHLLQNAREATPANGRVTLSLSDADGRLRISVRDTGAGMTAEFVRERLFRPFATTKGNAGMGIGAFEAREFVRSLGGELAVSSSPGAGSEFVINLPQAGSIPAVVDQGADPQDAVT